MIQIQTSNADAIFWDPFLMRARANAYTDMWDAGIAIHTYVYSEEIQVGGGSAAYVSVWVSNRMRDDIERAIMVLGLKGEYL